MLWTNTMRPSGIYPKYINDFIHCIIMSSIGRSQKKVGGRSMTAKGHPSQSARTLRQSGI